jgi:hypothetical protein
MSGVSVVTVSGNEAAKLLNGSHFIEGNSLPGLCIYKFVTARTLKSQTCLNGGKFNVTLGNVLKAVEHSASVIRQNILTNRSLAA